MANDPEIRSMTPLPPSTHSVPSANGARSPSAAVAPTHSVGLPPALSGPPSLETVVNVVQRRGPLIAVVGLGAALLAAAGVWFFMPQRQSSQIKVQVAVRSRPGEEVDPTSAQKAQVAVLKSDKVLSTAAGNVASLYGGQSREELLAWLQKDLTVEFPYGTEVLVVTLTGDRPELMKPLLDEVAAAYRDEVNSTEKSRMDERLKAVTDKHKKVLAELSEKKFALNKLEQQLGIKDPAVVVTEIAAAHTNLGTARNLHFAAQLRRTQAEQELKASQERLTALSATTTPSQDREYLDAFKELRNTNPDLKALAEVRVKIEGEIARRTRDAGPNPEGQVKAALEKALAGPKADLAIIEAGEKEVLKKLEGLAREEATGRLRAQIADLERKLNAARSEEESLAREVTTANARLLEAEHSGSRALDRTDKGLNALTIAVAQIEEVRHGLGAEIGRLETETVSNNRVALLESPSNPAPTKNDKRYKVAGATFLGVFGLVFLAFAFTEFARKPLRRPEEVSHGLALPVLGTVPEMSESSRRPLSADGGTSPGEAAVLEAIDGVRASVLHAARTEPLHILLVSSPKSGEGKTPVAGHLAASLARSWRNVLLIDGDLRQPSLHTLFDLPAGPGFAEVLRGEMELDEAVQATPLARLSVLPAGRCDRLAVEALSQLTLGEQMAQLKENFDFVVIDVSPVLETADVLQLGQHADAVILSVLRDVSRLPEVHAARERLEGLGMRVLGAVVGGRS
jgi:capsular exopolysaccharide synthesis family protein